MTRTPPPYRSQHDEDANEYHGDCGEACLAMLFEALGKGRIRIDTLSNKTGLKDGKSATLISEMLNLCAEYNVPAQRKSFQTLAELKALLANDGYFIPLIEYAYIPDRLDQGYKIGHFVLIWDTTDASVVWHDPDWWEPYRSQGAGRAYGWTTFQAAFKNAEPPYTGIWIPGVKHMSQSLNAFKQALSQMAPDAVLTTAQTDLLAGANAGELQQELKVVPVNAWKCKTTVKMKVREAAGTAFKIITVLDPNTVLIVNQKVTSANGYAWHQIIACEKVPAVVGKFIAEKKEDGTETYLVNF